MGFSEGSENIKKNLTETASDSESSALDEEESTADSTTSDFLETTSVEETTAVIEEVTTEIYDETSFSDEENGTQQIEYCVPENQTGFKSYMPYTALSINSPNYQMLVNLGYIDEYGLWKINECYCVAMGTYYSNTLGDVFEVELNNGSTFRVIIVDIKADVHTDYKNMYTITNGCITEFIVDFSNLDYTIKQMGSVGVYEKFNGTYTKITKLYNFYNE